MLSSLSCGQKADTDQLFGHIAQWGAASLTLELLPCRRPAPACGRTHRLSARSSFRIWSRARRSAHLAFALSHLALLACPPSHPAFPFLPRCPRCARPRFRIDLCGCSPMAAFSATWQSLARASPEPSLPPRGVAADSALRLLASAGDCGERRPMRPARETSCHRPLRPPQRFRVIAVLGTTSVAATAASVCL